MQSTRIKTPAPELDSELQALRDRFAMAAMEALIMAQAKSVACLDGGMQFSRPDPEQTIRAGYEYADMALKIRLE
jgi:hypothetical protein